VKFILSFTKHSNRDSIDVHRSKITTINAFSPIDWQSICVRNGLSAGTHTIILKHSVPIELSSISLLLKSPFGNLWVHDYYAEENSPQHSSFGYGNCIFLAPKQAAMSVQFFLSHDYVVNAMLGEALVVAVAIG
jgi:hypothetical protein